MSNNLTLNSEKIQFKQSQVSFYGHCWSKHGITINYLNRYSALSAHLAAPLSALTHQATDYNPGKVHFKKLQSTEGGNFQYEGTSIL